MGFTVGMKTSNAFGCTPHGQSIRQRPTGEGFSGRARVAPRTCPPNSRRACENKIRDDLVACPAQAAAASRLRTPGPPDDVRVTSPTLSEDPSRTTAHREEGGAIRAVWTPRISGRGRGKVMMKVGFHQRSTEPELDADCIRCKPAQRQVGAHSRDGRIRLQGGHSPCKCSQTA